MNRGTILFLAIFATITYLFYKNIESHLTSVDKTIEATNLLLLKFQENKGRDQAQLALKKLNLNIEAFQGLECARCHITNTNLLLPLVSSPNLTQEEYIQKARQGHKDKEYTQSDITDNSLKIQYRILQKFYQD